MSFPRKPSSSAFVATAIVASLASPLLAQPTNDAFWDLHFGLPGPISRSSSYPRVRVIELVGDEIYIGGEFEGIADVVAHGIAHWDGTEWHSFGDGFDAPVEAIFVEGSNVYAGGSFYNAGSVTALGIAQWDGASWSALGDGIDFGSVFGFTIYAIARYNDALYAAGGKQIDHAGGMAPVFASWDGIEWTSYVPDEYDGMIRCMESDGQHLYVGGSFNAFGPPYLEDAVLRWDGAALTTMGDGLQGFVFDLEVFSNQLHAVGNIYYSGAATIRAIAAWNGSNWYEVGGGIGPPANVYAATSRNGFLYVAGDFATAGGVNSRNLAWWDGTQWHAYTGAPIGMSAFGNMLGEVAVDTENIFVSGDFTRVDGVVTYGLGRWNGDDWYSLSTTEQHGVDNKVRALVCDGNGGLYAGGDFAFAGGTRTGCVGFFDGSDWHALGGGLSGSYLSVSALEYSGTDLWAGGLFTKADNVDVKNLARWDGSAWYDVGGGISGGSGPTVSSLHANGSDLYVGGVFTQAGAVPAANIAKWDGSNWQALGSGTNAVVLEIIAWNGLLYVGGNFTIAGGLPAQRVASWDGSNWAQVGGGFNSGVNAFAIFNGELYASGSFNNSGGQPMVGIAKWNGSSWMDVGGGLGSGANDIEAVESGVFACGPFQTAGGNPAKRIAKWTGTEWEPLGSGFLGIGVATPFVSALAADDHFLYIGGDFVQAGDKAASRLARWDWTGSTTAVRPEPTFSAGLGNCIPNPFNPSTTIPYAVAKAGRVTLKVYDVGGRYVRTLVDREHAASREMFTATWDGRDDAGESVASGVYFCRMVSGRFTDTRKMVLLK